MSVAMPFDYSAGFRVHDLLYKEFQRIQRPAGVMFIPLRVIVIHIAALRPVTAERDKRIFRNLPVLAFPVPDILFCGFPKAKDASGFTARCIAVCPKD